MKLGLGSKVGPWEGLRLVRDDGQDDVPSFTFDCRLPGAYRIELIDRARLSGYIAERRVGDYEESRGQIIWIEPLA